MQKLLLTFIGPTICWPLVAARAEITINLPAANPVKQDVGFFRGGTELFISATGTSVICFQYVTHPDGSLAGPLNEEDLVRIHATRDWPDYPTDYGGDGTNHFDGGGANYNSGVGNIGWPIAGKQTTDTTDPNTIRFGALVGTFSDVPNREDWFYIGRSRKLIVPAGGAHLYLLVNDSWYPDNDGGFTITIAEQPSTPITAVSENSSKNTPVSIQPHQTNLPLHDHSFGFALPAEIGLTHRIETSEDLVHWKPATNLLFFFKDLDSINFSNRFYRFFELK